MNTESEIQNSANGAEHPDSSIKNPESKIAHAVAASQHSTVSGFQHSDPQNPPIHHSNSPAGFVRRLPKATRDEICQLIQDGVPFKQIVVRLSARAPGLTPKYISNWKTHGGYDAWLREQLRKDDYRARLETLKDFARHDTGTETYQASPKIAVTLLSEALLDLGPDTFRKALTDDPRNAFRLLNSLARLLSGGLRCEKLLIETAEGKPHAETTTAPPSKGLSRESSSIILQDYI